MITEDLEDFLEHFGVKGMKWGVRKEESTTTKGGRRIDENFVLKKGSTFDNVSYDTARALDGMIYGAHKKVDVLNYRGQYADSLKNFHYYDKVFANTFVVKKDVKVASEKASRDAFEKLWNSNPEMMARSLANSYKDMKFAAAFNTRILKMNRDGVYFDRLSKKGEDWVRTKGFDEFTTSLASPEQTSKSDYFKYLQKRGYDAIVDRNDVRNYGSNEPILIFNGGKNLKTGKTFELTQKEINAALEDYGREVSFQERLKAKGGG